jgi:hypothetical protein
MSKAWARAEGKTVLVGEALEVSSRHLCHG